MKNLISLYVSEVIDTYELTYPLDIYSFVSTLGFNIKYVDTGKSDAYTIIIGGKKLILLDENITFDERINFTLAHELGHYFIPHHLKPLYACNVNQVISTKRLRNFNIENEADLFASELLLPNKLIKEINIKSFEDILNLAKNYKISIQTAAIKSIENTQDTVCFICCQNGKIKWYVVSENFRSYLKIKDIVGSPIPELSLLSTCMAENVFNAKDNTPAFVWLENVDDEFINEEVMYYWQYNLGYVLLEAESLINFEEELFL